MTSTDKDLSLTPLKGNSGKAYMGTYPNGDRVFVKMNTTPSMTLNATSSKVRNSIIIILK